MIQAGAMRNGNTVDAGFFEGRSHKKTDTSIEGSAQVLGCWLGISDAAQPCEP